MGKRNSNTIIETNTVLHANAERYFYARRKIHIEEIHFTYTLTRNVRTSYIYRGAVTEKDKDDEEQYPRDAIVINPNDLWQVVVAISGGVVTLSGAGAVITGVIHKAKSSNKVQNERLDALESNMKHLGGFRYFSSRTIVRQYSRNRSSILFW